MYERFNEYTMYTLQQREHSSLKGEEHVCQDIQLQDTE